MAPELLFEKPYDSSCDIYSIGCLIFELLFGKLPYLDNSIEGLMGQIQRENLQIPYHIQNISYQMETLLFKCLQISPDNRITWKELFSLEFINNSEQKCLLKEERKESFTENLKNIHSV